MAASLGNAYTKRGDGAGQTNLQWSHTLESGATGLLVGISSQYGSDRYASGVTYNNIALTRIDRTARGTGAVGGVELWYLPGGSLPAPGTYTISATWGTTNRSNCFSVSVLGGTTGVIVATTNGVATGSSSTPSASAPNCITGGLVVAQVMAISYSSPITTCSAGTNVTEKIGVDDSTTVCASFGSKPGASGSVAVPWTLSASVGWCEVVVEIEDGVQAITGTGAVTQSGQTLAGTGSVSIGASGTGAVTQSGQTVAGTGTVTNPTPTRFYFRPTASRPLGSTEPIWGSGWEYMWTLAQNGEYQGWGLTRAGQAFSNDVWYPHTNTFAGHVAGAYIGRTIWLSEPLAGSGTIDGTVKGQMRFWEQLATCDHNPAIAIRVVSNDGQTIRGTLLAPTGGNQTNGTPPEASTGTEVSANFINRKLPYNSPATLTPVAYQNGDRIQIELGVRVMAAGAGWYGSFAMHEWDYGDNPDLPEDNTTGAAAHEYMPWIEFSKNLVFQGDVHGDPLAGRLTTFTTDNAAVCAAPPNDYTDADGKVTTPAMPVLSVGVAHIQAHCEGRDSNLATVTGVSQATPVASITVAPTAPSGVVGDEITLVATCWDGPNGTGNILTGRNPSWSIDDATLLHWAIPGGRGDSMDMVLDKVGTAHVRAWVGDIGSNTAAITISASAGLAVGRIVLSPPSLAGIVGGQADVTATVYSTGATLAERRAGFLSYLAGLPARTSARVLLGQQLDQGGTPPWPMDQITNIISLTGKAPALCGIPAFWYATDTLTRALAAGAAGYLLDMGNWAYNPQTGGSQSDTNITFHNLLVAGATRTAWLAAVDALAAKFDSIKAAGYFVIFRPFIELNGDWFWWGTPSHATAADFIAVWQEMYTRLMVTHGLADCLIWDFNVNAGSSNYVAAYPGDAYVDIVSMDYYGDTPGSGMATTYAALQAKPKPIRIAEFGCHSSAWNPPQPEFSYDNSKLLVDIKASLPNVVMALVWSGTWGISHQNGAAALINDLWVTTRDELPSFGEQVIEGKVVTFGSSNPSVASVA